MKFKKRSLYLVQAYRLEKDKDIVTADATIPAKKNQWVVSRNGNTHVCKDEIFRSVFTHIEGETYGKQSNEVEAWRELNGKKKGCWKYATGCISVTEPHEIFVAEYEPADDIADAYLKETIVICGT